MWFGLVLWHIKHCSLFNVKCCLYIYNSYIWFNKVKYFQVLLCIINNSVKHQSFVYTQSNVKQFYFKQFNLAQVLFYTAEMLNSTILPIDKTLSGSTTPTSVDPESDGNEGVLCIPQSFSITGAWPSDCLMSYQEIRFLLLCWDIVGVFYTPRLMVFYFKEETYTALWSYI